MSRRLTLFCCLFLLIMVVSADAADKTRPTSTRVASTELKRLGLGSSLATADTCTVIHIDSIVWAIDNWVIGDELYKTFMDPLSVCNTSYPFTITEVHMIMQFGGPTPIIYGADIEAVDYSTPGCPMPDTLIAVSPNYQDQVPDAGLWDIYVILDPPVVVNEAYFAGFYLGGGLDADCAPAVITDDDPMLCTSYNVWDTAIGWIDLNSNAYWMEYVETDWCFPGRLALFSVGYAGSGAPPDDPPEIELVSPVDGDTLMGTANLWAWETTGSGAVDYVSFEYSSGGTYTEIGRDFDGTAPLRDGISPATTSSGFSLDWDFSNLAEGIYKIRVTVYDTLGQSSSDSVSVRMEPTPPTPNITTPAYGDEFCEPLNLLMTISDEDISYVELQRQSASTGYSAGLRTCDISTLGVEYNGPAAAAVAVMLWVDRGYSYLVSSGQSAETLAGYLGSEFDIDGNYGTLDEAMITSLREYFVPRGNILTYDYMRNPDYAALRTWVEEEQRAVMIGLSGSLGVWLTVDGFSGLTQSDGSYLVTVYNPLTGTIMDVSMREFSGVYKVYLNNMWLTVDVMLSILPKDWTVTRTMAGFDSNGGDGWSFSWMPTGLVEDSLYFFRAVGHDAGGMTGSDAVLLKYTCGGVMVAGDYNNDGVANVVDLQYLVAFFVHGGPEPVGGAERADANGDGFLNVADLVYYVNYVYGAAGPPAH